MKKEASVRDKDVPVYSLFVWQARATLKMGSERLDQGVKYILSYTPILLGRDSA